MKVLGLIFVVVISLFIFQSNVQAQNDFKGSVSAYGSVPLNGFDISSYDVGMKGAVGSKIDNLFVGLGSGYVSLRDGSGDFFIPIFLEGRYYLGKNLFVKSEIGSWLWYIGEGLYRPTFAVGGYVGLIPFNASTFNVQLGIDFNEDIIRTSMNIGL